MLEEEYPPQYRFPKGFDIDEFCRSDVSYEEYVRSGKGTTDVLRFNHDIYPSEFFAEKLNRMDPRIPRPHKFYVEFGFVAWLPEAVIGHILECIRVCKNQLSALCLNFLDAYVPFDKSSILNAACKTGPNNVKKLQIIGIKLSETDIASLVDAPHCVLEDIRLDCSFEPGCFQGWLTDYGKLKRLHISDVPYVSCDHNPLDLIQTLRRTPSKLEYLELFPGDKNSCIRKTELKAFASMVESQRSLKEICFCISESWLCSDVIDLLTIILEPSRPVEQISVRVATQSRSDDLFSYIGKEKWVSQFVPVFRKSASLVSLPDLGKTWGLINDHKTELPLETQQHPCETTLAILKRNLILRKFKKHSPSSQKKAIKGSTCQGQIPSKVMLPSVPTERKLNVRTNSLAKTLAGLASGEVEASALFFFLRRNAERCFPSNHTAKRSATSPPSP